jgi:hypothetical protein
MSKPYFAVKGVIFGSIIFPFVWMLATRRRLEIMSRFTPVVIAILLVCVIAGLAYAGGTPMTAKGDKQLVFLFSGLSKMQLMPYFHPQGIPEACFDDSDYSCDCWPCGGGLGFRYFINDDRAIRIGVNVGIGKWEVKDSWDETCNEFGLSLIYEKYLAQIHSVAPYLGVGLGFDYYKDTWTQKEGDYKEEWTGNIFSVEGVAGFQWYFTDGLSLGGEYRPAFQNQTGKMTAGGETTEETSGYALNHRTGSVFLAAHF